MKLIILTQYYPPEIGAPQARLSELAERFARSGHEVTVLTAMPNYPKGKIHSGYGGVVRHEQRNGVEVIRTVIYPTQSASFEKRLTNYFSFVLSSATVGMFVLPRADFLLVESPPLFLGLSGMWLSWWKGAKLIFNVSDLWPESAASLGLIRKESLAFRLSSILETFCYARAWLISGQSKSILKNISERFPNCSTFHLSNGVDVKKFSPDKQTSAVRSQIANNGECVALYAGLHGLAQGLDQILDVAAKTQKNTSLRYVFVGDGPEKQSLIRRAQDQHLTNVLFLNSVPSSEMPALIASSDVILVTLKKHIPGAVPSKLYEAMASGKPVVLAAEGEAAEIVQSSQAGLVVKPGDIEGLRTAVEKFGVSSESRKQLGENGRRTAVKTYSRETIVEQFIRHLELGLTD